MKTLLGLLLVILSIVFGLYVGFYLCLVGGIVGIIQHVKSAETISAVVIAFNLLRIMAVSLAGWLTFMILFLPGLALLKSV